jgi:hypothetical protein
VIHHLTRYSDVQRLLEKYQRENGHCKVPQTHPILGPWVRKQRSNRTELSQDCIDKLDSIGLTGLYDHTALRAVGVGMGVT